MRICTRLNPFTGKNLTDTNVSVLSLADAVRRWTQSGQFLMTEVNHVDSYESNDSNISLKDAQALNVDKFDAVLSGIDFAKQMQAGSDFGTPTDSPAPAPVPAPAE